MNVTDPVKQGEGVGAFVSYKVRTTTDLPQFRSRNIEVVRRFRDFAWLGDKLRERHRGVIIPALPEKSAVQKYQMSTEFIETRRRALQVFINRVCAHDLLQTSQELQWFLEEPEDSWAMKVAVRNQEDGGAKKKVNNFFKGTISTAQHLLQGRVEVEREDEEYIKLKEYLAHLETHLNEAHRQSARLIKKQNELGLSIGEFGVAADKLGKYEEEKVHNAFERLVTHTSELRDHTREGCKTLNDNFEAPMKEFTRMMKSVKNVIADRATALTVVHQAKMNLDSHRVKVERLRGAPGKQEKVIEAEQEVERAEAKKKAASDNYENLVKSMSLEITRFQKERATEMSKVLRDFALAQAQLASQSAKEWGALVAELQN